MTTYQKARSRVCMAAAIVLGFVAGSTAATMTLAPSPYQVVSDSSGNPISGACVWTYTAGTSSAATTYTDKAGAAANTNPIVTDANGHFTAYLAPGSSYKFVYENIPCSASSHGAVLWTYDNIDGTPASASAVDITGTAGETISAGNAVYLSDGSGGKNAGQWYKADSVNTYSSLTPEVGIAISAIAAASTGTIRTVGSVTGLSALTAGTTYYVGTSGALTSTPPTFRRAMGVADSTTSLVLKPWQIQTPPINNTTAGGRLTLTSGTPVTSNNVSGASTLFYTQDIGNSIALYDGTSTWTPRNFSEISLALSGLVTAQVYDVFVYDNAGTPALETAEWANATVTMTIAVPAVVTWTAHGLVTGNSITFTTTGALPTNVVANTQYFVTVINANTFNLSTTRANVAAGTLIGTAGTQSGVHTGHQPQAPQTALARQDGVLVKSGASTRRYLGMIFTSGANTTEDTFTKRYVWNYYNRRRRVLERLEATATWGYTLATFQQANASASNQVEFVVGQEDPALWLSLSAGFSTNQAAGAITATSGIGEDSTTTNSGFAVGGANSNLGPAGAAQTNNVIFLKQPTKGYHALIWLEKSTAAGVTTWQSTASGGSGLWGWIEG